MCVGAGEGWKEVGTAREGFQLLTSNDQRLRSAGNATMLCFAYVSLDRWSKHVWSDYEGQKFETLLIKVGFVHSILSYWKSERMLTSYMQCMRNNNLDQDCRLLLSSAIITLTIKKFYFTVCTPFQCPVWSILPNSKIMINTVTIFNSIIIN